MTESIAMPESVEVPLLSDAARKKGAPLSLVTRGGGLVFVSGDVATRTQASPVAVEHWLKAAGSDLSEVLMARAGFDGTVNAVSARFYANDPPARTFVPVASRPTPFGIEIERQASAR